MFDDVFNLPPDDSAQLENGVEISADVREEGKFVKCQACGGNLVFDPKTQTLLCEHCGSAFDFDKDRAVREIAIEEAFAKADLWTDAVVVRCANCGAKVVIDANEVGKECPYCGTSQVRKTEEIVGIRPNAIYPFTIEKTDAEGLCKKWVKRKFFAPRKFKKNIEAQKIRGVFEPCFSFDSSTYSTYNGRVGYRRTRVVGSGKNRRTETYIEWRYIKGSIDKNFDDIMISASKEFPQEKLSKCLPLNFQTIAVYKKQYLAGYVANHYDRDVKSCWNDAKSLMDNVIRSAIVSKYHADVVDYINVFTSHNNVTYKYVLVPIYLFTYPFKKKEYILNVNGNTGKVWGKTPVSFWKVLFTILFGIGAIFLIAYIISNGG